MTDKPERKNGSIEQRIGSRNKPLRISRRAILHTLGIVSLSTVENNWHVGAQETQSGGSWPQFGYDSGRSGYAPNNTPITGDVEKLWEFPRGKTGPVVHDGIVFVGGHDNESGLPNPRLYAIDASDGGVLWWVEANGLVDQPPVVYDNKVYFGDGARLERGDFNGKIYKVNISDGSKEWTFDPPTLGKLVHPLIVTNDTVYAPYRSLEGNYSVLYSLDIEDGDEKWRFTDLSWPNITVTNRTVYLSDNGQDIYAIDASTGTENWSVGYYNEKFSFLSTQSLAVEGNTIYAGSRTANKLHALNTSDGTVKWSVDVDGGINHKPAIADGTVYARSSKDEDEDQTTATVYAFDTTNEPVRELG